MRQSVAIFSIILILTLAVNGEAGIFELLAGQGTYNTLGAGDMPPVKSAYGYSVILVLGNFLSETRNARSSRKPIPFLLQRNIIPLVLKRRENVSFEIKYGVEIEQMLASRSEVIGNIKASIYGVLAGVILAVEVGKWPMRFLLSAGYGFYSGSYTLISGNQKAELGEECSGVKFGILWQVPLSSSFIFTLGGSYRLIPFLSGAKQLNFSGFGVSTGVGLQL